MTFNCTHRVLENNMQLLHVFHWKIMSLVMAAEQQTFGSFFFFLLLKDNKSVLQLMVAAYVYGSINLMQKVCLMSSLYF